MYEPYKKTYFVGVMHAGSKVNPKCLNETVELYIYDDSGDEVPFVLVKELFVREAVDKNKRTYPLFSSGNETREICP